MMSNTTSSNMMMLIKLFLLLALLILTCAPTPCHAFSGIENRLPFFYGGESSLHQDYSSPVKNIEDYDDLESVPDSVLVIFAMLQWMW